jgi:hypothetical protein
MLPDTTWKTVISNATVKVLTGLKRCSKFEVRVQSVCTSTLSSAFTYAKFETGGCQSACSTPHYLKAQVVDVTTAILTWENTGARAYVVEIKTMMDSMSTSKFDTVYMNSYKISGLQKCKTYAYRVRAYCGNGLTGPSETFIFQTPCPPACVAPKIVGAILNSDTVGVVGWDALLNEAAKYEIQYRLAGDSLSQWISARTDSREYKLTALKRCAVYEIRVRRICSDILFSEWSYTKLETKGCTTNTCFMPTELRADSVSGGVIMYWAGTSGGKYEIQYRQSGIVVTDWKSQYTTTPGFKLQLPCGLYEWRVRKYCENGGVSDWAFGNKFMVANCVSPNPCIMPTLLESSLSGDSIAVVKWEGMLNSKYEIQYRPTTTTTETQWTSITTTNLKAEIKLGKCNIYEWRVRKICDNVTSDWAYGTKIITKGCITNGCTIPINIKVASINDSTFIKWEVLSTTGALFEVQYRNANDSIWKSLRSQSLYSVILGLQKCTKYIIRVRAVCADNQFSDWVETTFSFGCLIGDGSTEAALISNSVKDFSIYPNPGNEYLQVSYKLEQESEVNIDMLNLQGQVVSTIKGGVQGAGNYMQVFENLNDTKAGMYLIIVRANGKVTNTQKWIKQ